MKRLLKIRDRVIISDNKHPWVGHSGVITEEMWTVVGFMWCVELDNGMVTDCRPFQLSLVESN